MNRKELFLLTIGFFLTVIAWLVADIYHVSTQEKIKAKISIPKIGKYDINEKILTILKEKTD